jgi:hypothetical protein
MAEPIVTGVGRADPEHEALLADSVGLAVLHPEVVLRVDRGAVRPCGRPLTVAGFAVAHGKIVEIDLLADPTRPQELDLPMLGD